MKKLRLTSHARATVAAVSLHTDFLPEYLFDKNMVLRLHRAYNPPNIPRPPIAFSKQESIAVELIWNFSIWTVTQARTRKSLQEDNSSKHEKLPKAEDVKKQLEALAGRDLHVPAEQLISIFYPAGAYAYSDGSVCWRSIFPISLAKAVPMRDCSMSAELTQPPPMARLPFRSARSCASRTSIFSRNQSTS